MPAFAAVMTGKGAAAIATILVFGDAAEVVTKKMFKPAGGKPAEFEVGRILLGAIVDPLRQETIDQATIGCEGTDSFAINCHGNPLIVEMIMQILQQNGVVLLGAEELAAKIFVGQRFANTIAIESRLAQLRAQTIEGAKIIANQVDSGLGKKAQQWLQDIDKTPLEKIVSDAEQILCDSQTAKLIIDGSRVVLAGPPNTGKSTLLNCLAGRQKAIVSDIKGTTRDWVSARCRFGPLAVELIDTAGLGETLASARKNTIEKAAQKKTAEILEQADLVLLILDSSQPEASLDERFVGKIGKKKVLTVLNKSDLPARLDTNKLPEILKDTVKISAKFGTGIENLMRKILQISGVADFGLQTAVCFTSRQENLLKQLAKIKSKKQAAALITELLSGPIRI
jgi:tRNA modification GTPase